MVRFYSAKTDGNQEEIVAEFRRLGATVEPVHRLKNHCDIDVYYRGETIKVEIKLPGKKLTEGEAKFKSKVEAQGCRYSIIHSIDEAQALIVEIYKRTPKWRPPSA